jgi:hypothetical protein
VSPLKSIRSWRFLETSEKDVFDLKPLLHTFEALSMDRNQVAVDSA